MIRDCIECPSEVRQERKHADMVPELSGAMGVRETERGKREGEMSLLQQIAGGGGSGAWPHKDRKRIKFHGELTCGQSH
jgi:hypothetical protein